MRLSIARTVGLVATLLAGAATAFAQTSSVDAAAAVRSCTPNPAAPRATVEGKVTDTTGVGLPGVNVSAQCGNFRQDTRTVADGTYALNAPSGNYVLVVEASGFQTATRDAKISPDAPGTPTSSSTSAASRASSRSPRPAATSLPPPPPPPRPARR